MRTLVKGKIDELEYELMKGCLRRIRKEFTGVVKVILGKKMFLVRF